MLIQGDDAGLFGNGCFDFGALQGHHSLGGFATRALDWFDFFQDDPAFSRHTFGVFCEAGFYPRWHFVADGRDN